MSDTVFEMTIEQAAEFLGLKPQTLYNKKYKGEGPRCEKRGKQLYYRRDDLAEWHERTKKVYQPKFVR